MYLDPWNPKKQDTYFLVRAGIAFGFLAVFSIIWHLTTVWRIAYSAHATATIKQIETRNSADRYGSSTVYQVAMLTFVRIQDGVAYNCDAEITIDRYAKGYAVGRQLDVVPRSDSCWLPLVVGLKTD
ncbi:hypothetical protein [Rhizobium sp. BK376]|uniref:hypothetical protein n=1 Tax=Rhizobium sp. BK376 TaxID=2512149 RepID=UPI001053B84B|nr:hypothetical protein [Rhizobium sp. BK376]TCR80799.1 hypothetical protein EV561_11376 [Rhizobium sp. BK376]